MILLEAFLRKRPVGVSMRFTSLLDLTHTILKEVAIMKTLVNTILAVLVVISILPSAATSQTKEAEIRVLLEITGTEELSRQSMHQLWPQMWDLVGKAHPGVPEELLLTLQADLHAAVDETLPIFMDGTVKIYSEYFTQQEISELVAWYKTPLGQKTIEVLPVLLQKSFEWGQKWGEEVVAPRAIEKFTERMKLKGYQL